MTNLNVDSLYLARNLATAILNISQSFQHKVGLKFNFIIEVNNDLLTIRKDEHSNFLITVSKQDFEKALNDRSFLNYNDNSQIPFIGHSNIQYMNSCCKFNLNLDHILLSIPDTKLSLSLISKYNN